MSNFLELLRQRLSSKTYLTAIALAGITVLEANMQLVSNALPPELRQYLIYVWPVAMLTLREVTNTALAYK